MNPLPGSFSVGKESVKIPALGFGVPKSIVADVVRNAVESGYTHIDCAPIYENEGDLGKGFLRDYEKRNELFITSKLSCFDQENAMVHKAFNSSLSNLCLQYMDLYLIHNPARAKSVENKVIPLYFKKEWITETYREMEKLVEAGKVKLIGVSNFTVKKLSWILDDCTIFPSVNQVELHPYLPQTNLIEFCHKNDIHVTAYAPLGTRGYRVKEQNISKNIPVLLENPIVEAVAKECGATAAQVLISWAIHRGTSVLTKTENKLRMVENLNSLNIKISENHMMRLNSIKERCRYVEFDKLLTEGMNRNDFWDYETVD